MRLPGFLRSWLAAEVKAAETFTPVAGDTVILDTRLPLSRLNYHSIVRGGLDSNVVMAPIQWIMRQFPEAEPVVERKMSGKPWERQEFHDAAELVCRPNDGYDGSCLMQATALSYAMDGNAYWLKRRNAFGRPIEYWYIPHWLIEPRWDLRDPFGFIAWYDYTPEWGGPVQAIAPADIVHLRFGIDPRATRKGLSQLKALMREVYTDEEAAHFSATILRNMGVPGIVLSPKTDVPISDEDVTEVRRYLDGSHIGENRGKPLAFGQPTDVQQFGFDPNRLTLTQLRDVAEERVCAALGLPAAVVGFGAGLQSTKVGATMRELRRLAWVQCLIPMQIQIARQLSRQVLEDFEGMPQRWRIRFDTSGVSAFQEEETEKIKRITSAVQGGILLVNKAQEMAGFEADPSQNVYLRPSSVTAVKEGDAGIVKPQPIVPPPEPGDEADPDLDPDDEEEDEETMDKAVKLLASLKARGFHGNGGE